MSRENWCSEKSQLLKTVDNRIPVLNEIKEYVSNLTQEEAKHTTDLLQLPLVFDCLNDSNSEQIELACEVLTICLGTLDLGDGTARFYADITRALNHPDAQVKRMALKEILRDIHFLPQKLVAANYKSLLAQITRCIADRDLSVASSACEILTEIGKIPNGIETLASPEVRSVFEEVMSANEVVRMRLFDVIIAIAKTFPESLAKLDQAGFVTPIILELNNTDVLIQLNVIELLSGLAETEYGFVYLETRGVIKTLCDSLRDTHKEMYIELCEPGILKFFGHVAHHKPEFLIEKYSSVLDRLFENLQSTQGTILGVSLNTLSYIVDKDDCKIKMDKVGNNLYETITKIVESLGVYPNDIKIKGLHCVANFLNVNDVNNRNVTEVTQKWYGYMQPNPMDWIMRYAKNPFGELRTGGLMILNSLAKQYWGHEVIRNTPGLIEFLLDRNIETLKECKEIKYEIVKRLQHSSAFNHEMQRVMQKFVHEGPFYVQGVTEIALEGED